MFFCPEFFAVTVNMAFPHPPPIGLPWIFSSKKIQIFYYYRYLKYFLRVSTQSSGPLQLSFTCVARSVKQTSQLMRRMEAKDSVNWVVYRDLSQVPREKLVLVYRGVGTIIGSLHPLSTFHPCSLKVHHRKVPKPSINLLVVFMYWLLDNLAWGHRCIKFLGNAT